MDKNQILELLKTVKYPGFNRDVVSFGMVKDIEVKEDGVKIYLNISSQNDEKKQLIVNAIKTLLIPKVKNLKINIGKDKTHPIQTQNNNCHANKSLKQIVCGDPGGGAPPVGPVGFITGGRGKA